MTISCYLNFSGDCRQAVEHYERVFDTKATVMTYGELPPDESFPVSPALGECILHAKLDIQGCPLMLADLLPDAPFVRGNNLSLTLNGEDPDVLTRWFQGLSEGGTMEMPLGPTFWSELYGAVVDRFGVCWQVNLTKK